MRMDGNAQGKNRGNFQDCSSATGLEHRRTDSARKTVSMKKVVLIDHTMGLILLGV